MAINYPQFRANLTKEDMGVPDYLGSLNKGLNLFENTQRAGYLPQRLQDEQIARQQLNKIKAPYADNATRAFEADIGTKEDNRSLLPLRERLLLANAQRNERLAEDPFGGRIPTGAVGQAYWLKKLEDTLPGGKENTFYQKAEEAANLEQDQVKTLNDYRKSLIGTASKRASTPLGKLENEISEIDEGFMPGTNKSIKIEPEEAEILKGQYELAKQKLSSDVDTRKKLLYATNLDKTLNAIDVDDLVQYSGVAGEIEKKIQQGRAIGEREAESFERYHKALTASKLLAKQVRQFYGDSITPGIQEQLAELTNPSTWKLNPRLAKAKFNQFKSILQSETQTYRDSLGGTSVYRNAPENNFQTNMQKAANIEERDPLGLGI